MPFHGILPHRQALFPLQPVSDIAVNDAHAWRLSPAHRRVYDKLYVALAQNLAAAPCGVDPLSLGLAPQQALLVKPIINLVGLGLNAQQTSAQALSDGTMLCTPGCFWSEFLYGTHSSTDCLVREGEVLWFAHTLAAAEKNAQRPLYWHIGVELGALENRIAAFIAQHLGGYTGLCNVEMIGGAVIEMHLRGSHGFFEFYGADFIAAWVQLVDSRHWQGLAPIREGYVYSLFGSGDLPDNYRAIAAQHQVAITPDTSGTGRRAVLHAHSLAAAQQVAALLENTAFGTP